MFPGADFLPVNLRKKYTRKEVALSLDFEGDLKNILTKCSIVSFLQRSIRYLMKEVYSNIKTGLNFCVCVFYFLNCMTSNS